MHIHVFAIDVLPAPGIIATGGGLRSRQIVEGLRSAGAEVTYSIPRATTLARSQWDLLTPEERDNAFALDGESSYLNLLSRFKPDAAVFLWPSVFVFPRSGRSDMINVYDANGFQNVEGALAQMASGGPAVTFQQSTIGYLRKLEAADIVLTGAPYQRAYWSALRSFANNSFTSAEMIDIPYYPQVEPIVKPYSADGPTFFVTGSFLPWNSPEGYLRRLTRVIDDEKRGQIVVVGRANASLAHAENVRAVISDAKQFNFVSQINGLPYDQLSSMINGRGVALDLQSRTLEREFAVPIRTITFLTHGVPVITNTYSAIGAEIVAANAGWGVDSGGGDFEGLIQQIIRGEAGALDAKSASARELARNRYKIDTNFKTLVGKIEERRLNARKGSGLKSSNSLMRSATAPCVAILSDDHENFLQLRAYIPFNAMLNAGLISGYHVFARGRCIRSVGTREKMGRIDAIWVQRYPLNGDLFVLEHFNGRYIYDIDDNLLVAPSYRPPFSDDWCNRVRALLAGAGVVSCTNAYLAGSLQRHSGVQIEHKTALTPNMSAGVNRSASREKPSTIILASSDFFPLTHSRPAFLGALSKFAQREDLEILYIGTDENKFPELKGARFSTSGFLGYDEYRRLLESRSAIALAPLEGHERGATAEFISCKSDIKMVEYGASGVPCVYSKVPPYLDSPLRPGPLVDMSDEHGLIEALEDVFENAGTWAAKGVEQVIEHRLASVVATKCWFPAIEQVLLPVGVPLDVFQMRLDESGMFGRRNLAEAVEEELFAATDYLEMNPDVSRAVLAGTTTAFGHYTKVGLGEGRSWFPGSVEHPRDLLLQVRNMVLSTQEEADALSARLQRALKRQR